MATPAAILQVLVTSNTAGAVAGLRSVDAQTKKTAASTAALGKGFSALGAIAKTAIGGGVAYALYQGVKAGVDFEKQMDAVGAVANASAREMKQLEKQALKLGQSTAFSANEVAQAQEELVKGGLKLKDVLQGGVKASLSLAAAGQLELADASTTTVNAMKLFAIEGKDAMQVANMLATAANKTTADVSDFSMALTQGGSAAKAAGYNLNQTITVLEALAQVGIKNSDAGTSMKTAFLQLLAPTEKQKKLAEQLNIEWVNQAGNLKSAAGLSRELQDAMGDMTNAQQAQNLKLLAGTDGFRTLNALLDQGPDKLRALTAANEKQGTSQEIAKEKMDNMAGALEQLQGAYETLSIKLMNGKAGMFRDIIDGATQKLTEFTDIVTSNKLTGDEKVTKVMEMISQTLKEIIPDIAKAAFAVGRAIAKGIADAFWHGDILTKLFIGGAVLKMFGGVSTLMSAGSAVGSKLGLGMKAGLMSVPFLAVIAAGLQGLSEDNKIKAAVDKLNKLVQKPAIALGNMFRVDPNVDTKSLRDAIEGFTALGKISEKTIWKMVEMGQVSAAQGQRMIQILKKVNEKGGDALIALSKTMEDTTDIVKDFTSKGSNWLKDFADDADRSADKAGNSLDKFGDKTKTVKDKVGANIMGLASIVTDGLDIITTNTNKALKGFGVKKIAISFANVNSGVQSVTGHQKGGAIVPGRGEGDKVPAMLEPGEVVINKKAVQAMGGPNRVNSINQKIPRFAKGGVVGGATSGLHPSILQFVSQLYQKYGGSISSGVRAGDSGSLHSTGQAADYVPSNWAGAAAAANSAGSSLLEGIYNPAVHGGPPVSWDSGSKVSSGFWGSSTWADHMDHIHLAVADGTKAVAGAAATTIKRLLLKGPDGPLKNMGQGALDKVRNAANKYIQSKMPPISAGRVHGPVKGLPEALQKYNRVYSQSSGFGDGYAMPFNAVAALAEWAGAPGVSMARTAIGESQLEPGAVGFDPGGTRGLGLWMITTGYNDALIKKLGGESQMRNPVINAQAMNSIFDSQGIGAWYSQTADSSNTHYNGPLLHQRGGIIQKLAKGGKALHGSVSGGKPDRAWKRFSKARRIAQRLKDILGERGRVARIDESIGIAETLAGAASSPGGSDLSPEELAKQIRLNEHLLEVMVRARKLAHSGMGLLNFPKGMSTAAIGKNQLKNLKGTFGSYLTDLTGVTGKGGRIFDTKVHLDELRHTSTSVDNTAQIADLTALLNAANARYAVSQAQYGVFDGFRANGGRIAPGKWAVTGERGPEVVHGPASVTPISARPSLTIEELNIHGDGRVTMKYGGKEFEAAVRRVTRTDSRKGGRVLPGRAGS